MKHLIKLVKLLVFGVGGLVACILLLGWALAQHGGKQEPPRPDLSNLAWDTMNKDHLGDLCGGEYSDKHVPGMPKFKVYRSHEEWMDCMEDLHKISESANQVMRVEASGLQNHDLDIAVSLDADRRDLAAMVKDFRAKWQPPVKK